MNTTSAVLLSAHLAATAVMTGVIWFVQIVHYPLFDRVGEQHAVAYAESHQRRTTYVVGLPMAVEGVASLVLLAAPPAGVGRALPFVGAVLLAVVYASTVFVLVPLHASLARAYDAESVLRLVRGNWVRTIGWTARVVVAVIMLLRAAQ